MKNKPPKKSECRTFLHENGYTRVSLCNCKYGGYGHGR